MGNWIFQVLSDKGRFPISVFVILWAALSGASARQERQSTLPADLRVPATRKLTFQAHGVGDQIYACTVVAGKYAWTLKGPDANLLGTNGQPMGRHFLGPTWEARDGSRVVGKVAASAPSPDQNSVPWLRLDAMGHDGKGAMSEIVAIQRLNTKGGKPSLSGCDVSNVGAESRVPYEADYYFFEQPK